MPIFSADNWFISSLTDSYIFLEDGMMHFFSGKLSTGTGLGINFEFWLKCTTKININSYPIYNGNVERGLSPER